MNKGKMYISGQGCLAVLKVEIFFKFVTFFVIGPFLDWIFTTWVVGDTPVFNEGMFFSVLSPLNLVLTLVLFLAAALWCYYEISCLIHAVYFSRSGQGTGLEEVLKGAWGTMKGMKHISILLAALYFVLFLPLVHAGYLNSLVPKVEIPRFVIGELNRTSIGSLGGICDTRRIPHTVYGTGSCAACHGIEKHKLCKGREAEFCVVPSDQLGG